MSTLVALVRRLAPFRWRVSLAVILSAAMIACNVGLLGMAAYLIADAALRPLLVALTLPIYLVRFAGVARAGARYAERLVGHDVTFRLLARLRTQVYRRLVALATGQRLVYRSGDLLVRLVGDVDELQHVYLRLVGPFLVAGLMAILTSGLFALFSPLLAWTALAFLCLAGIALPLLTWQLGRSTGARQPSARAALTTQLADGIQGVRDIVAFGQQRWYAQRITALDSVLARLQRRMALVSGVEQSLNDVAQSLAMWVILVLAIPLVRTQRIGGVYLAFLVLVMLASFEAVQPLAPALQFLGRALASGQRVLAVVDQPPQLTDTREAHAPSSRSEQVSIAESVGLHRPELRFDRVSFAYAPKDGAVLQDISFVVPPGGRVAIVGPSGAGKSTIARLALRFVDPSGGSIRLDGEDLSQRTLREVRATLSLIAQDAYLFNTTLRANLLLACPDATDDELMGALEQAQLGDFVRELPEGLGTWLGEHGQRLSGGERQRLALARVLLRDPPLLILDEPTANLDPVTEHALLDALDPVMRGRSAILITHRLCRLERMDEILVLDGGRIVERGTHSQLLEQQSLYRRMLEVQNSLLDTLTSDAEQTGGMEMM